MRLTFSRSVRCLQAISRHQIITSPIRSRHYWLSDSVGCAYYCSEEYPKLWRNGCGSNPSGNFTHIPLYRNTDLIFYFISSRLKSTRHLKTSKELMSGTLMGEIQEFTRRPTYVRSVLLLHFSPALCYMQLPDVLTAIRNLHTIDFDVDEYDTKRWLTCLIDRWGVTFSSLEQP